MASNNDTWTTLSYTEISNEPGETRYTIAFLYNTGTGAFLDHLPKQFISVRSSWSLEDIDRDFTTQWNARGRVTVYGDDGDVVTFPDFRAAVVSWRVAATEDV